MAPVGLLSGPRSVLTRIGITAVPCATPYLTGLAITKLNIFENHKREAAYIFRKENSKGLRLSGKQAYTLAFQRGRRRRGRVSGC